MNSLSCTDCNSGKIKIAVKSQREYKIKIQRIQHKKQMDK